MIEYFQIELSKGKVARVSKEDFEELSKYKWFAQMSKSGHCYAKRHVVNPDGTSCVVSMQDMIMNPPDGFVVDHKFGDTLDYRRGMLRLATPKQNARNSKKPSHNTTGFKGVYQMKKYPFNYMAYITVDGKVKCLGTHQTAKSAHYAYCCAAEKYFGEFARAA